jgi:putative membrane protein
LAGPDDLDIDARFLLANERTLLAWIRTTITFLAGGLAAAQLAESDQLGRLFGSATLLLGASAGAIGYRRFHTADRAIRAGELPPPGRSPALLIGATGVLAVGLLAVVATGAW